MSTSTTPATAPKLSDTQLIILTTAAQHPERAVAMPDHLKGGAVARVVGLLLAKGLVEAVPHRGEMPVYKTRPDGSRLTLVITDAGLQALGIDPNPVSEQAPEAHVTKAKSSAEVDGKAATPRLSQPRTDTKQSLVIAMLRRPQGATVPEIMEATGWLAHTTRAALSHALKKKLGLQISSEKVEGRGRVHRVQG